MRPSTRQAARETDPVDADRLRKYHSRRDSLGENGLGPLYYTIDEVPHRWNTRQEAVPLHGGRPIVDTRHWQHRTFTVGDVTVVGRLDWKASAPRWANEVIYYNLAEKTLSQFITSIVVHHTNNDDGVRENELKQKKRGYAALGYHFFITKTGTVYEGRPLEVLGSHAGRGSIAGPLNDPDWGAVGIVLQGDYHNADNWFWQADTEAPSEQLKVLKQLIVGVRDDYGVDRLLMHRDVTGRGGKPTVCPGDAMASEVERLRTELGMSVR